MKLFEERLQVRGLSFTEPWGTLCALGKKKVETRGWWTSYRGLLAIHAAGSYPATARVYAEEPVFRAALGEGWVPRLGFFIAVAELVDCVEMPAVMPALEALKLYGWEGAENEEEFGVYEPGRYMLVLRDPVVLAEPVPFTAHQKIFRLKRPVQDQLIEQWRGGAHARGALVAVP
jgi:hypothetical protein